MTLSLIPAVAGMGDIVYAVLQSASHSSRSSIHGRVATRRTDKNATRRKEGQVFRRAAFLSWFPLGTRPLHNGVFSLNTPFFSGHASGCNPGSTSVCGSRMHYRCMPLRAGMRFASRRTAACVFRNWLDNGQWWNRQQVGSPSIARRHPSSSPGQRHKQGSGQAPVTRVGSQASSGVVAGPGDEGARSIGLA